MRPNGRSEMSKLFLFCVCLITINAVTATTEPVTQAPEVSTVPAEQLASTSVSAQEPTVQPVAAVSTQAREVGSVPAEVPVSTGAAEVQTVPADVPASTQAAEPQGTTVGPALDGTTVAPQVPHETTLAPVAEASTPVPDVATTAVPVTPQETSVVPAGAATTAAASEVGTTAAPPAPLDTTAPPAAEVSSKVADAAVTTGAPSVQHETTTAVDLHCFVCEGNVSQCRADSTRCPDGSWGSAVTGCYVKVSAGDGEARPIALGCITADLSNAPPDINERCANSTAHNVLECLATSGDSDCFYCCYSNECNSLAQPEAATTAAPGATDVAAVGTTAGQAAQQPSTAVGEVIPTTAAGPHPPEQTTAAAPPAPETTAPAENLPTTAAGAQPGQSTAGEVDVQSTAEVEERVTTAPVAEVKSTAAAVEPASTAAAEEPVTTARAAEVQSTAAVEEPVTTAAAAEAMSTAATEEPASTTAAQVEVTLTRLPTTVVIPGFTTAEYNDTMRRCYICNGEPLNWCNAVSTDLLCRSLDDVCFSIVVNVSEPQLDTTRGCMPRNECQARQNNNSANCVNGAVTSECTYCCDTDRCNIDYYPPAPTNATTTTTTTTATTASSAVCDMLGYVQCLNQFQSLVMDASTNPDIFFNKFCASVPSVFRCLANSMEGCTCPDSLLHMNETLEAVLTNMTAQCPNTCDPPAGYNCSQTYYYRVAQAFVTGGGCSLIEIIDEEQERCRVKTVGSCDTNVRDRINITYSTIRREWTAICQSPPELLPLNQTDSSTCSVNNATKCIEDMGYEIVHYLNFGGTIKKICSDLDIKEKCYHQNSVGCSRDTQKNLELSWSVTRGLIADQCTEDDRPKCDTEKARSCILDLWKLVDEAKDFQAACNLMDATIVCVVYRTAGCSLDDQLSLNRSLQIVIDAIGNSCSNIVNILPSNNTLEVWEGGRHAQIVYSFTSSPSTLCGSGQQNCRVYIEFDIEVGNGPLCRNRKVISQAVIVSGTSGLDACSREVTADNWNVQQNVTIAAKLDFKYDGTQRRNLTVWMKKVSETGSTLERRSLGSFLLIIYDMDQSAVCSSINDPHTTTFDGRYFNNFQEGFFILYRHIVLPYEVQIISQRCNGKATCNCGAGVRSGDTVFFVDRCRKKSFVGKHCHGRDKYNCKNLMKASVYAHTRFTPGTRIFSRNNGKDFYVWFPHGAVAKISVSGDYVNVWVTASPADWESSEGLCGYYNGDKTDDLRKRDGGIHTGAGSGHGGQPTDFTNNWRVHGNEKMYGGVDSKSFTPPFYCECRANDTRAGNVVSSCGYDVLLETCDWDKSGVEITIDSSLNDGPSSPSKPTKPPKDKNNRRRRATATEDETFNPDLDIDTTYVAPEISRDGETQARAKCQEYFDKQTIAQKCLNSTAAPINNSVDNCVEDLLLTDNSNTWLSAALEGFKQLCSQELSQNSSIPDNIAKDIEQIACPNDCNGNGTCVNKTCRCFDGFTGDDCGFDLSAKFEYIDSENGVCDVRSNNCSRVKMSGVGFIPNITRCVLQSIKITESGINIIDPATSYTELIWASENEVHCIVSPNSSAYVMVENDVGASSRSAPVVFVAYDAVCYKCANDTDKFTCVELTDSCVINGVCYGPNEESPDDPCLVCRPDQSRSAFSKADSCMTKGNEGNEGLIIGLVIGLTAFVALVVALVVCLVIKYRSASARLTQNTNFDDEPPAYDNPAVDPNDIPIYGKASYTSLRGEDLPAINLYDVLASQSTSSGGATVSVDVQSTSATKNKSESDMF